MPRVPNPDRSQVRRRNIEPPPTVLLNDGVRRGPELPKSREWPAETLEWWDVWRRSPLVQGFTETDWSHLIDTAVCHARFWTSGDPATAAELRRRESQLGATVEDRIRLKIQIVDNPGDVPLIVTASAKDGSARSQRERLLKAVDG